MSADQALRPVRCDHGLRRTLIVQSILADVFDGRMRAGQHLITRTLAERFGVSDTPIREALVELSVMGIIDLLPNRGAVVSRVTLQDIREISHVRRVLECEAVRTACGNCTAEELQDLKAGFEALSTRVAAQDETVVEEAARLDARLHDLIALRSGNRFLAKELNRLKTLFRVFRDVAYSRQKIQQNRRRLEAECAEHLAIVAALVRRRQRAAVEAMSQHVFSAAEHWCNALGAP